MSTRFYYWFGANREYVNFANQASLISSNRYKADPGWNGGFDTGASQSWGLYGILMPGKIRSYGSGGTTTTNQVSLSTDTLEPNFFGNMFISPPLQGDQAISGTFKGQLIAVENNSSVNAFPQIIAYVISKDGRTRRGTLSGFVNFGSEFSIEPNPAARPWPNERAISTVNALDGDRIVVELGVRTTAAASGRDATLYFSYGSTDIPEGSTATYATAPNAPRGWLEFSADLVFAPQRAALIGIPAQEPAPGAGSGPSVDPPTVTMINPPSGSVVGTTTPLAFRVSHADGVAAVFVSIEYADGSREAVYEPPAIGETGFATRYYSASQQSAALGEVEIDFIIQRNPAWPATPSLRITACGANGVIV